MFFVDILIAKFLFNFIFVHDIALSRSQTISMEKLFDNVKVTLRILSYNLLSLLIVWYCRQLFDKDLAKKPILNFNLIEARITFSLY